MKYLVRVEHDDESIVRGWRQVLITDSDQPYMDKWWIPGTSIGYEHSFIHQVADFLKSLEAGEESCEPTFQSALEAQKVCEAVIDSANSRSWKDTGVKWWFSWKNDAFSHEFMKDIQKRFGHLAGPFFFMK